MLSVITHQDGVKDWAVACVSIEENKYIHESISTFFTLEGAIKTHCMILGDTWDESFDDYC